MLELGIIKNTWKLLIQKSIIFYIALATLVLSGLWFLFEGGFEPFMGLISAIGGLLSDYLLNKRSNTTIPKSLKKLTKSELLHILTQFKLEVPNQATNIELIKIIEAQRTNKRWEKSNWILTMVALMLIPVVYYLNPPKSQIEPTYKLAFYTNNNGQIKIVSPDSIKVNITDIDIRNSQIKLPINIAVSNAENEPLEVVKVEIFYPSNLNVISKGKLKIAPNENAIIYEHEIGTLTNIDEFTPLGTIDTIKIKRRFIGVESGVIFKDSIPAYSNILTDDSILRTSKIINLKLRITCKDRPPIEASFDYHLPTTLKTYFDLPTNIKTRTKLPEITYHFPKKLVNIDSWSIKLDNSLLDYQKLKSGKTTYQIISLNKVIRRINVDSDSNGLIDTLYFDKNNNNYLDMMVVGDRTTFMWDWQAKNFLPKE